MSDTTPSPAPDVVTQPPKAAPSPPARPKKSTKPKEPKEPKVKPPKVSRLPPPELAKRTGRVLLIENHLTLSMAKRRVGNAEHNAAASLHGWKEHRLHTGEPLHLTAEDYEAAIVAARSPGVDGKYVPHQPALSPHNRHGFAKD